MLALGFCVSRIRSSISSVDQYQAGLDNGGGHNHVTEDPKPEQELMAF